MYTRKSCCWSLLICCIITGFHLQDSPCLFIYLFIEKKFSLSLTNKHIQAFWSFSNTLLRRVENSTNFLTDEDVEGNWNGRGKNQPGTQAVRSLISTVLHLGVSASSKSSPHSSIPLPITSSLPAPSWKSELETNTMATTPEESHCSCSFSWDNSLIPLWVLTTQKQNTFFFFFFEAFMKKNDNGFVIWGIFESVHLEGGWYRKT